MPKHIAERIIDNNSLLPRGTTTIGAITGITASHVLATTAGLGVEHRVSGLTAGQVLRATGATTAAFASILDADLPATLVRTSRTLAAGSGLTGGGDLSADRTFSVGAGTLITINADDVALANGTAQYQIPVTGATPFVPGYALLSSFAGDGLTFSTDFAVELSTTSGLELTGTSPAKTLQLADTIAGNGLTIASKVMAVGVSGLGLGVGADAVTLTSSSNPGAAASILATDADGYLQLVKLRTPTIDTPNATSLTLKPTTNVILDPDANIVELTSSVTLKSDHYASQTTGWGVTYAGAADFRYLFVDEMHAKSFIADLEQALAGGQIIAKSVAVLYADFTAPAAGGATTLTVRDLPSAIGMAAFVDGDFIRVRNFSRANGSLTIGDCWGTVVLDTSYGVSGFDSATKTQRYTFTRSANPNGGAMAQGTVVYADAIILDYGTSGNGYYEVNAIDGQYAVNSPYAQIVTWATHPRTQTVRTRFGNLVGIFSAGAEYGLYAGDGVTASNRYIRASDRAIELRNVPLALYAGASNTLLLSAGAGNDAPFMAMGSTLPTGPVTNDGLWLGKDGSDYEFRVGTVSGGKLTNGVWWNGSTLIVGSENDGNITLTSGALAINDGVTERIGMTAAGVLTIKDSGGAAVFTFDASAGAEFTKPLTLGASGGIYQGTGTFASPTTGLKIYRSGDIGLIAGYNSGVAQWYATTTGKLAAGGGQILMDAAGLELGTYPNLPTSELPSTGARSISFWTDPTDTSGTPRARMYAATDNAGAPYWSVVMTPGATGNNPAITLWRETNSKTTLFLTNVTDLTGFPAFYSNATSMYITGNLQMEGTITAKNHILPHADVTYNLGSGTYRWSTIYADNIVVSSLAGPVQGGFAQDYLFCDDVIFPGTSPVWHELETQSDGGTTGSHTTTSATYAELDRYVTPALGTTIIPAGTWAFSLYVKMSALTGQIRAQVYRVNSSGAIVGGVLGTAESAVFNNTTTAAVVAQVYIGEQTGWAITDRVGVVVSGKRTSGVATLTFYHDFASGWSSRMTTPITLLHNQLKGLNEGDYKHLTATEYSGLHARSHSYDSTSDHSGTLSWSNVNKTGSNLTDLATRAHSGLTNIGANDHHNQSHVLASTTALGTDHTVAGLTAGQYLRATAATTAAFEAIADADLPTTIVRTSRTITSGGGLTGGGDLSENRTLAVGAGALITVNADDVALANGTAQYQIPVTGATPFVPGYALLSSFAGDGLTFSTDFAVELSTTSGLELTGTSPAKTLQLADTIAGNGLTIASKVMAVGVSGLGLGVGADAITLTSSSAGTADAHILATDANGYTSVVQLTAPTIYGSSAANGDLTLEGTSHATKTSSYLILQPTGGKIAVGKTDPTYTLDVTGDMRATGDLYVGDAADIDGRVDIGSTLYAANNTFRVEYHTVGGNHAHVIVNPSDGWTLDEQFGVDIDDNLLVRGWIVGKHAIQLPGASMICHFDGPEPYETNFTGAPTGHMGQAPTITGGVIYRPGKFGKAVQIAEATTNLLINPSFEGTYASGIAPNWHAYSYNGTGSRAESSDAYIGSKSQRLTRTGSANSDRWGIYDSPGKSASAPISAQIRFKVLSYSAGATIWIYTEDVTVGNYVTHTIVAGDVGEWKALSYSRTTDTSTTLHFYIWIDGNAADILIDAAQAEEKAYATPYCDGSLGTGHTWSGTEHASTSSRTATTITYPIAEMHKDIGSRGSIMMWVNASSFNSAGGILWCIGNANAEFDSYIGSNGALYFRHNVNYYIATTALSTNTWYHFAYTWDSGTGRYILYINGVLYEDASGFTEITPGTTLGIGYSAPIGSQFVHDGLIDDFVLLNRAATADEIRAVYESNAPVFAETATWQWRAGRNRFWSDAEGIWMLSANGGAMFGAYAGEDNNPAAEKTWGGLTLMEGDLLIGNSTSYALWDKSAATLSVKGTITADAGSIGGWSIVSDAIRKETGSAATSAGMAPADYPFYAGSLYANRATAPFRVTNAGVLTATSGTIGGWTLSSTTLSSSNISIDNTGKITAGTSNDIAVLSAADATYRLWIGHATAASAKFSVTKGGALYAEDADITGNIDASTGSIGGWTITSGHLYAGTGSTRVGMKPGTYPFYAGATDETAAPFRVTTAGAMYATDGYIGGWNINSDRIVTNRLSLISGAYNTAHIFVGQSSWGAGINSANASGDIAFWAGTAHADRASAEFRVTAAGALHASSATITGAITASSGSITGTLSISGSGKLEFGGGAGNLDVNGVNITGSSLRFLTTTTLRGTLEAANPVTSLLASAPGVTLLGSGNSTAETVNLYARNTGGRVSEIIATAGSTAGTNKIQFYAYSGNATTSSLLEIGEQTFKVQVGSNSDKFSITSAGVGTLTGSLNVTGTLAHNSKTVWDAGNDGTGSGLDADLLDGQQGSVYLRSDIDQTGTDSDLYFNLGRAKVGYITGSADSAAFAHRDMGTGDYALSQTSVGDTYLNAKSTKTVNLRVGNTALVQLTASVFNSGVVYQRNSVTGYIFVPMTSGFMTDDSATLWNGINLNAGTWTFDAETNGCDAAVKAVVISFGCAFGSPGSSVYIACIDKASGNYPLVIRPHVANIVMQNVAIVPVDSNQKFDIIASGGNPVSAACKLIGYFL